MTDPTQSRVGELIRAGVCILAAGKSARMGRPKLLLPWGTTTILGQLVRQWARIRAVQIAVVTSEESNPIEKELTRLGIPPANRIVNPEPDRGMFSSIQCAARWPGWANGLTHWIIALGDQPHLKDETLRTLIERAAVEPGRIWQPRSGAKGRHPVLLPRHEFEALGQTHAADLKEFMREHAAVCSSFGASDPGLDLDIDTPEDYERARRLFAPAEAR